jgi:hypothetical protein
MGPLGVVNSEPGVGEGAQLRDGFKEVRVQQLGSVAPIVAVRCMRSDPACEEPRSLHAESTTSKVRVLNTCLYHGF